MNKLETLLQQYCNGEISQDGMAELERLTRRDEIMQSASRKATKIVHRMLAARSAVASVLIVAAAYFALMPTSTRMTGDAPIVAQNALPLSEKTIAGEEPVAQARETTVWDNAQHATAKHTAANSQEEEKGITAYHNSTPAATGRQETAPQPAQSQAVAHSATQETIVACNTECSPDSVINDIWNFLKA